MGFIDLLQLVTTCKDYAVTIGHAKSSHRSVNLLQSSLVIGWQRFPTADVPLPLGYRTVPGLSYQILTATSHNS
jgi:hypothetical protein